MFSQWRIPKGGSFVQAVVPTADLSGGAIQGPWANLRDVDDILIILFLNTGTSPPVLALQQAQDASGTGAKALNIMDVATLPAADINAPDPATTATEVWNHHAGIHRRASVASLDTDGLGGEISAQFLAVMRVKQDVLDDGFTHVRLNCAALGAARAGHAVYIANEKAHQGSDRNALTA